MVEGSWEFAKSVNICFVYLEKAFRHGVLRKYGPLLRTVQSLYDRSRCLVHIAHVGLRGGCPLWPVLLASSRQDLQYVLGWLAAGGETAGFSTREVCYAVGVWVHWGKERAERCVKMFWHFHISFLSLSALTDRRRNSERLTPPTGWILVHPHRCGYPGPAGWPAMATPPLRHWSRPQCDWRTASGHNL